MPYFSKQYSFFSRRFFDKAAIVNQSDCESVDMLNTWRICTVTQVEELKILIRMLLTYLGHDDAVFDSPRTDVLNICRTRHGNGQTHRLFWNTSSVLPMRRCHHCPCSCSSLWKNPSSSIQKIYWHGVWHHATAADGDQFYFYPCSRWCQQHRWRAIAYRLLMPKVWCTVRSLFRWASCGKDPSTFW